jgi:glyoxylase-like metal-dependent hydrolase (beta-lactamase superfamily II)
MSQNINSMDKSRYTGHIRFEKEGPMTPTVKHFFDKDTWTLTYVVYDSQSRDAVVIDPVWDYDPAASKMSTQSADEVIEFVEQQGLKVHYILETHAHADHVSGSQILKAQWPSAKVAIGAQIKAVQEVFKGVFNLKNLKTDGSQFDLLIDEGQEISAGTLNIDTIYTPGHTPACASYVIGDAVFTGDALFMPDYGTGRCDFPAGSADDLYTSVHDKLYTLPDTHRVFVGHDYMPNGRELKFEATIGEEKQSNIQLKQETSREEFVRFRTERDKTLAAPRLLLPSVQVNIDAGHLPQPEDNETSYLKIPVRQ